jgi:Uma2 family endonuclease
MVIASPPKYTWDDLRAFPEDGKRREIIGGVLFVAAAPSKRHQTLLGLLHVEFFRAIRLTGWGRVYVGPVDIKFSEDDVVQPDLIAIREDRMHIYRENPVTAAPDIVVEIVSPSSKRYDEVTKRELYAAHGVSEYWLANSVRPSLRLFALRGGEYVEIQPKQDGKLYSMIVPGLVLDPAELLGEMSK